MPCPTNSGARPLTPDEQIGGLQRSVFNALADAERLREACREVAAFRDCEEAADWKDARGRLTRLCAAAITGKE